MSSKDQMINELVLENGRLKAEAARAMQPCRTCQRLKRHDCGVFFECPLVFWRARQWDKKFSELHEELRKQIEEDI